MKDVYEKLYAEASEHCIEKMNLSYGKTNIPLKAFRFKAGLVMFVSSDDVFEETLKDDGYKVVHST